MRKLHWCDEGGNLRQQPDWKQTTNIPGNCICQGEKQTETGCRRIEMLVSSLLHLNSEMMGPKQCPRRCYIWTRSKTKHIKTLSTSQYLSVSKDGYALETCKKSQNKIRILIEWSRCLKWFHYERIDRTPPHLDQRKSYLCRKCKTYYRWAYFLDLLGNNNNNNNRRERTFTLNTKAVTIYRSTIWPLQRH